MFNHIWKLAAIALVSVLFNSCQKVIDLDLKKAEKRLVIDAIVTDELGNNGISIISSKPFDENNTFDTITNAQIWVQNTTTNTVYPFTLFGSIFRNVDILAIPNHEYALTVVVDQDTFSGICVVPNQKVLLDSIRVEKSEFSIFAGRDFYVGVPVYQDPIGRGNNYLLRSYLNGVKKVASTFDNDDFIDGQVNKSSISFNAFYDEEDEDAPEFEVGDTLTVELLNIDRLVYDFYSTLAQNSSAIISNPANPRSNINGKNVLGVFNVATISRKSVIAQY